MTAGRPAAALAIALALSGAAAAQADTLHLLAPSYSDATATYFAHMGSDFSAANPGVVIAAETVPWDALRARLAAAVASGHPPDLAIIRTEWLAELVRAGTVDPLEARMSAEFKSRFIGDLLSAGQIGAHQYGLPVVADVQALYYNRDLLDRAGLPGPPASWTALLADSHRLRAAGIAGFALASAPGAAARSWSCALLSYGGAPLDAAGHVAVTSDAGASALRLLRAVAASDATRPATTARGDDDLQNMFAAGELAMVLAPQRLLTRLRHAGTAPRFSLVAPPAQGTSSPANCASSDSVVMLHATAVRGLAFKFLDFMFTRTPRLAFIRDEGLPPVTKAELRDKYVTGDADRALFGRLLLSARFPPLLSGWPAASAALDDAVASALRDESEPAAALAAAAERMNAALAP